MPPTVWDFDKNEVMSGYIQWKCNGEKWERQLVPRGLDHEFFTPGGHTMCPPGGDMEMCLIFKLSSLIL